MADTAYERYVNTAALLACQKESEHLANHDELAFQMVHQVAELWMKLCCHELDEVIRIMTNDEARLGRAAHLLRRAAQVLAQVPAATDVLHTMRPADYMVIRAGLGTGSGMESPGFHLLLETGGRLADALNGLLARRGMTPLELHRRPEADEALYQVLQGVLEFDATLQRFRLGHVLLVMRQIGNVVGTGGQTVPWLLKRAQESLVPEVWAAIGHLSEEHRQTYGGAPQSE